MSNARANGCLRIEGEGRSDGGALDDVGTCCGSLSTPVTNGSELADAIFQLELSQFSDVRVHDARSEFKRLARCLAALGFQRYGPRAQAALLSQVLYRREGFRYGRGDSAELFTLTGTLSNRTGSCLGLTTLYVCLSRAIASPLRPILFEGHIAVGHCAVDPPLHIETSERGNALPDRWVRRMHGPPTQPSPLTDQEFLAVHLSNRAAFVLVPLGHLEEALCLVDAALELFPNYMSGLINRAVLALELGDEASAEQSLARAAKLGPQCRYSHVVEELRLRLTNFRD
jgi:regulator of sirC expression with transglutaminase-like and TPR domain